MGNKQIRLAMAFALLPLVGCEDTPGNTDAAVQPDASACGDYSGAYLTTGSCNTPSLTMPPLVCVRQKGCSATVYTSSAVFTGEVAGAGFTLTTTMPIQQTCTGTVAADQLSIECKADQLSIECSGSGGKATLAGTSGACCDVSAQDCGADARCTVVGVTEENGPWVSACVPIGKQVEGDLCTRTGVGRDECGKGLMCVRYGLPEGMRACRKLCTSASECGSKAACLSMGATPTAGACVPTCAFFDASCPMGTDCTVVDVMETPSTLVGTSICLARGKVAAGKACSYADDCVAGTRCDMDQTCRTICDDQHPCVAPATCAMGPLLASGAKVGVCR